MKKLQVKTESGWQWVFCHVNGAIATTQHKSKSLPTKAMWAAEDLDYFSRKFGNNEFRLAETLTN